MSYEHRRAAAVIRVRDASGRPVARRRLRLEQRRHDFRFGCGAFDAIPFANGGQDDPFLRDRTEKWLRLFNYGTLPFYWGRYEPEEGRTDFAGLMNAARFLAGQGVRIKGHPLCWHTVCADWLMRYDDMAILDRQLARIQREVSAFAGVIDA